MMSGLDGRRDAGIQIVHVDLIDGDLDARQLAELGRETLELDVGGRHEAHPFQDVEPRSLRKAWGLLRRDNGRNAARGDPGRRARHHPEKCSTIPDLRAFLVRHGFLLPRAAGPTVARWKHRALPMSRRPAVASRSDAAVQPGTATPTLTRDENTRLDGVEAQSLCTAQDISVDTPATFTGEGPCERGRRDGSGSVRSDWRASCSSSDRSRSSAWRILARRSSRWIKP